MVTVHGPHEARSRAGSLHDRGAINVQVDIPGWSGVTTSAQRRGRNDKLSLVHFIFANMASSSLSSYGSLGGHLNSRPT